MVTQRVFGRVVRELMPAAVLLLFLCGSTRGGEPAADAPKEAWGQAFDLERQTQDVKSGSVRESEPTTASEAQQGDLVYPMIKAVGGFGLVLSLLLGGFAALRKFAPQLFRQARAERRLKVVESLGMGDKRSIAIVEIEGKRFLIGNTVHQISLLSLLEERVSSMPVPERARAESDQPVEERKPIAPGFRNILDMHKGRPAKGVPKAGTIPAEIRAKMHELRQALES